MPEEYTEIIELSHQKAKECLLKESSYCTFDLPRYFQFKNTLSRVSNFLKEEQLSDHYHQKLNPKDCEGVNYTLYNNKHGKYAWRPLELIHPVLYVDLVNVITHKDSWKQICKRIKGIQSSSCVECSSIPIDTPEDEKDDVETVTRWWQEVEQKSIESALEYDFIFHTDISACYDSLYTHSVCWAIHGKDDCKNNRSDDFVGNQIDESLKRMSYAETNGVPQGSKVMDFVAEIVLHYADIKLTERLNDSGINTKDFNIFRYRDDYRIFTKNTQDGKIILRNLTEVLANLGFNLNDDKTSRTENVIKGSVKDDKLYWMQHGQEHESLQKQLHVLKSFSEKYPNSGTLNKKLNHFYGDLGKKSDWDSDYDGNIKACVSIITEIGLENPRTYPMAVAIISRFIDMIETERIKISLIQKIKQKTERKANTSQLLIWLQRITLKLDKEIQYEVPLCKRVTNENQEVWNSDWIDSEDLNQIMNNAHIVNHDVIEELGPYIGLKEVTAFSSRYN